VNRGIVEKPDGIAGHQAAHYNYNGFITLRSLRADRVPDGRLTQLDTAFLTSTLLWLELKKQKSRRLSSSAKKTERICAAVRVIIGVAGDGPGDRIEVTEAVMEIPGAVIRILRPTI